MSFDHLGTIDLKFSPTPNLIRNLVQRPIINITIGFKIQVSNQMLYSLEDMVTLAFAPREQSSTFIELKLNLRNMWWTLNVHQKCFSSIIFAACDYSKKFSY